MKDTKLNKVAKVVAKLFEVIFFASQITMLVCLIISMVNADLLMTPLQEGLDSGRLTITSTEITVLDANGQLIPTALKFAFLTGVISMGLYAMIFRNIYLIFKTTEGKTWFAKGETPFQADNVRMVREIGIFSIMIPIINFILSLLLPLFGDAALMDVTTDGNGLVFGIIVLCLSRYFAYGVKLQEDVDGLI